MTKLTHIDKSGNAMMVDVSTKETTTRSATAISQVQMSKETLKLITSGLNKKGDVLTVAKIAGIQAAKNCSNLIPLCHPLMLSSIEVNLEVDESNLTVNISSTCKLNAKTGVEMEALTAVSVAALTIYDMCKAADKNMVIGSIKLIDKQGGKSGHWKLNEQDSDEN